MNRTASMARMLIGVLALIVLVSQSGCTWTETYRDYPPDVEMSRPVDAGHVHGQ